MIEAGVGKPARLFGTERCRAVEIGKKEKKVPVVFGSTGDAIVESSRTVCQRYRRKVREFRIRLPIARQSHEKNLLIRTPAPKLSEAFFKVQPSSQDANNEQP